MKKIAITILLSLHTIFTSAQLNKAKTGKGFVDKINQPYQNKIPVALSKGYEIKRMLLPFTDSEAEYTVQKIGHDYIMNGDIVVGNDLPKTQSFNVNSYDYMWNDKTVPVKIDAGIYFNNMQDMVFDAIDEINTKLCVTVVPQTTQGDYVNIVARGENELGKSVAGNSAVGKKGGEQLLRLLVGNDGIKGTLMHEMLHAMGIYHEMERPDRDKYIRLNWDNIEDNLKGQYNIKNGGKVFGPFDYCSIMLYSKIFKDKNTWDAISNNEIVKTPTCDGDTYFKYTNLDINGLANFYSPLKVTNPSGIKIKRGSAERFIVGMGSISSESKKYKLIYDNDGCLKIIRIKDNSIIWNSPTKGKATEVCIMQADGNLVIYGPEGVVLWSSATYGNWGSTLNLTNTANLIIKNNKGVQIWSSNSYDNPTQSIQLKTGYVINGTIKWSANLGVPESGISKDWFTIKSYGPIKFEENNDFTKLYTPNGFIGRYLDYKDIGTISFEPINKIGEFYQVKFNPHCSYESLN